LAAAGVRGALRRTYNTSDKKEKIMPKSADCKMQFADFLYFALIVRADCYIIVKKETERLRA